MGFKPQATRPLPWTQSASRHRPGFRAVTVRKMDARSPTGTEPVTIVIRGFDASSGETGAAHSKQDRRLQDLSLP